MDFVIASVSEVTDPMELEERLHRTLLGLLPQAMEEGEGHSFPYRWSRHRQATQSGWVSLQFYDRQEYFPHFKDCGPIG